MKMNRLLLMIACCSHNNCIFFFLQKKRGRSSTSINSHDQEENKLDLLTEEFDHDNFKPNLDLHSSQTQSNDLD